MILFVLNDNSNLVYTGGSRKTLSVQGVFSFLGALIQCHMQIADRVYGNIKIKEQVIQDLINSKPLQRLKKISQGGADNYLEPRRNVNRFEHSVVDDSLGQMFEEFAETHKVLGVRAIS